MNLLLICCDHLRADWLGCNGHPIVQTPQIDKLAAQGVNFQRAMSECPVCVPARRILMTGLNSYRVKMDRNRDEQPFPEGPKLAELLTRHGYQTFASGKLHVHPQRNRIGFEDVQLNEEGRRQGGLRADDYEMFLQENQALPRAHSHGLGNNQYGLRLSPLPEPLTTTHWTAQQAMRFLERRDPTRPFFLYVSFDKPHPPITPPRDYYELYDGVEFPEPVQGDWCQSKVPDRVRSLRDGNLHDDLRRQRLPMQQSLRGFAAMITHIDSMIGQILGTLREHGLLNDTWVVLTSDHGDHLFDHGNYAKGDFFQGSCHIPFIITPAATWRQQHPQSIGRIETSQPMGLADLLPTFCAIAGCPVPPELDGTNLLPALCDPTLRLREYLYGRCNSHFAVTDGRYRYQWAGADDLEFLFDQDHDARDLHDLSGEPAHQATRARLRSALTAWMQQHDDPHVVGGVLTALPGSHRHEHGRAVNHWNNRGRHGV